MRPDLSKCLTECYRSGAGSVERVYKIKRCGRIRVHPDPEHEYENERGGFHSSSRHRQHDGGKSFGDNLGALKGNLKKNIGRPWDDVFSEFCQNIDRRSLNGHHVWTHLREEVAINTCFNHHGVIIENGNHGPMMIDGFYVHPETKTLEYYRDLGWRKRARLQWKQKQKDSAPILVPGSDGWRYEQIDGLWYRCKDEKKEFVPFPGYPPLTTITSLKRSCNKKEIAWIRNFLAKSAPVR